MSYIHEDCGEEKDLYQHSGISMIDRCCNMVCMGKRYVKPGEVGVGMIHTSSRRVTDCCPSARKVEATS